MTIRIQIRLAMVMIKGSATQKTRPTPILEDLSGSKRGTDRCEDWIRTGGSSKARKTKRAMW
jgi:hypothetical protein